MTNATPGTPPTLTFLYNPAPGVLRQLTLRTPDENTLAVWRAVGARFQTMGQEWAETEQLLAGRADDDPDLMAFRKARNEQASDALSRALRVITSPMINQADRDWIEDLLLEGRLDLAQALGVITGAIEEMKRIKDERVAQAPTTGPAPAKKARRT